jgi:hypothetical protein
VSSESNKIEMIILPIKIYNLINKELIRVTGESATSDLNYEQGKKIGVSLVKGNFKTNPIDIKRYLNKLISIGYYCGVSSKNSHIKSYSNNKIILSGKSRFDQKNKDSYSSPILSYVAGYITGFMEGLTAKKWKGRYIKKIKDNNIIADIIIEKMKY